jgi:predicted nucleic acid-binding protein
VPAGDFIVYVETNWLVACVLPHHAYRHEGLGLLDAAERGECALRIPKVAFVEARHVVERETQDHAKAVNTVSSSFEAAARNLGRPELQELARRVKEAEASYHLANPRQALESLIARCSHFGFQHPIDEQAELDALRPAALMRGADISDLHILAAISADRALDPAPPAAVCSANSHEFSVTGNGAKLPRDFYASRRLVYRDTFDLAQARRMWASQDRRGWPVPVASSVDPRIQEAQRLLQAMPEERRDAVLAAIRRVRNGG